MEAGPAELAPPPEPEVLEAGPLRERRPRYAFPLGAGLVALLVAALLAWQFWPRPVAPVTYEELQGIYAGMVRGDGTNDASRLDLRPDPTPHRITPADCLPLFDVTTLDSYPAEALDGMGTFWMAARVGASLATYRFPDAEAARRAYVRIDTALKACDGTSATIFQGRRWTAAIERTPVTSAAGADQLGYLYSPAPSTRFAVHVLRYENLLTWQYRYDTSDGTYAPLPAQQIMDSLLAQMRSVVDLREK